MMISAVVLTHNDEATIELTLKSIQWCSEIVAIDDYSTDTTVEIVKRFTKSIFVHHLNDDFSAQRNFGLSKAKGEWVLFVDSDEVVSEKLKKEIKERLDPRLRGDDNFCSGYYIRRSDYWGERWLSHGETGNIRLLRLARKSAGLWKQPVHEVWDVKRPIGEFKHPLLHYPHPNVAQFIDEINRYSTRYAQYLFHTNVREPSWHIAAKPVAKFFHNYLFRLGFLDGTAGVVVAIMMSFHSFLVRGKLWLLWDKSRRNNIS